MKKNEIKQMVVEELSAQLQEKVVRSIVEGVVREQLSACINEAKKRKSSVQAQAKNILNSELYNNAEIMRYVEKPKSKSEEDTLRSLYSKYAKGTRTPSNKKANKMVQFTRVRHEEE